MADKENTNDKRRQVAKKSTAKRPRVYDEEKENMATNTTQSSTETSVCDCARCFKSSEILENVSSFKSDLNYERESVSSVNNSNDTRRQVAKKSTAKRPRVYDEEKENTTQSNTETSVCDCARCLNLSELLESFFSYECNLCKDKSCSISWELDSCLQMDLTELYTIENSSFKTSVDNINETNFSSFLSEQEVEPDLKPISNSTQKQ